MRWRRTVNLTLLVLMLGVSACTSSEDPDAPWISLHDAWIRADRGAPNASPRVRITGLLWGKQEDIAGEIVTRPVQLFDADSYGGSPLLELPCTPTLGAAPTSDDGTTARTLEFTTDHGSDSVALLPYCGATLRLQIDLLCRATEREVRASTEVQIECTLDNRAGYYLNLPQHSVAGKPDRIEVHETLGEGRQPTRVERLSYTEEGMLQVVDVLYHRTVFEYTEQGVLREKLEIDRILELVVERRHYSYDEEGRLSRVDVDTDPPDGVFDEVQTYSYEPDRWTATETIPGSDPFVRVYTWDDDATLSLPVNNRVETVAFQERVTDPNLFLALPASESIPATERLWETTTWNGSSTLRTDYQWQDGRVVGSSTSYVAPNEEFVERSEWIYK